MSAVRPQLDALTGARGLAAWLVVLFHVREGFAARVPEAVAAFLAKGYLAVDLFFMLSGFVMWLTYAQVLERDGLRMAPDFLRRRIARIYPLHFVILMATVGLALAFTATGRPLPPSYDWSELPLNLLLIQNWGFTSHLSWNDPSWSISTELGAYLIFPLAGLAILKLRPSAPVALAIIAALAVLLDRYFALQGHHRLGDDIPHTGLVRCIIAFVTGMLICTIWQQRLGTWTVGAAAAITGAALILAGFGMRETLAIPIAFAALLYLLARTSGWRANPLSGRVLVLLGDISYSTYLVHFLLWKLFKLAFVADPRSVPTLSILLFLLLTLAASFLLYHLVEKPGRSWMRAAGIRPARMESRTT